MSDTPPPHRLRVTLSVPLALASLAPTGCTRSTNREPRSAAGSPAPAGQVSTYTFDAEGGLPAHSEVFAGDWRPRPEPGTPSNPNALCQSGVHQFPAIALGPDNYQNLVLTARFKAISGKEDQAAGLIFHVQDKDNYYILRANALENNVNFYVYAGGQRSVLNEGQATVSAGQWHELRAEITGQHMTGYLDGKQVVASTDNRFGAGRIGLWTKADSVTCFDDVTATAR